VAFLALKVDVDTLRGTREGVPRLLAQLDRSGTRATFLYSLGPDRTGRALRRIFRPGFFKKVQRTSVIEHYGLRTLLYGTLLPGPDIGRTAPDVLRAVRAAGHENGVHTWDHVEWQDFVHTRDARWTHRRMTQARERFIEVFGVAPATHGAAGWQMNQHALIELDNWGLAYASDGRTTAADQGPYRLQVEARELACVQLPTTLPTFDALIGIDGASADDAAAKILAMTGGCGRDHVFTLHAELEGARLAPQFAALLSGWRAQGYQLGTLGEYYARLDREALPVRTFAYGSVPGRSGELMVPGGARPVPARPA
jgi:undecaprenyl phosphate-alpha-L-ara4FN deformylase